MSNYSFNYSFNITGNCDVVVQGISQNVEKLNDNIRKSAGLWDSFEGKLLALNQFTQYVEGVGRTMQETLQPGAALNASLADLSAISGETGESLRRIEGYARETAKTFGGSAAQSIESYKLLLSQLSPELAKYPDALRAMGDNIAVLSKTMGGDATAAAEVLTTAMNQYGISLADPMEAARRMAEMMNVMAAAGKEGSAELPAIKVALEQCGMAAKGAGVSFEETNAAIQVLDKAGKKGAEGGVALRNVMMILSRGRFLPKETLKELQVAGVDVGLLTDKTRTLAERLEPLKVVLKDSALFSQLFGMENSNAAMALVQGIDEIRRYEGAITGTNTAVEQAGIIMESYNERLSRVRARFDDLKISLFNASGDWGIWVEVVVSSLVPLAQITPLLIGIGKGIAFIRTLNFAGMWRSTIGAMSGAIFSLQMYNGYLSIGKVQALGFGRNILQATVAAVRFATVGLWSGIKALGAYILSLVTGGTASATFAGIASTGFATFKLAAVTACRAVSVAIMSIPLVGWIAAAIAALAAIGIHFWNTSVKFRATLKGLWASFKAVFSGIWELAKNVFGGIGDLIVAAFKFDGKGIREAIQRMKGGFSQFGAEVGSAFTKAYDEEIARSKAEAAAKEKASAGEPSSDGVLPTPDPLAAGLQTFGATVAAAVPKTDKIRNITVHIDKLIDRFEIHTTNLREDVGRVKDMITETVVAAVNDINFAG